MGAAIRKKPVRGQGTCETPECVEPKSRGSFFCLPCKHRLKAITKEFKEDPRLLYNQRSDSKNRRFVREGGEKKRVKSVPTCCTPGCYEHREPPSPFCFQHQGETIYD